MTLRNNKNPLEGLLCLWVYLYSLPTHATDAVIVRNRTVSAGVFTGFCVTDVALLFCHTDLRTRLALYE